jgi:foldase protein PrsA
MATTKKSESSKKKASTTKTSSRIKKDEVIESVTPSTKSSRNLRPGKKLALLVVIIGLAILAYTHKNWFIAAQVNGQPITNFEVLSRLNQIHRTDTLNQMVNEKILYNEAKKKGVSVTEADIQNKIAEIEKNVGGADSLNDLLSQQSQTRKDLEDQIKIQLLIE